MAKKNYSDFLNKYKKIKIKVNYFFNRVITRQLDPHNPCLIYNYHCKNVDNVI